MTAWPLAAAPADYVLGHVRAVLPDRIIDDALIAVSGGRIADVEPHRPGVRSDVDGQGLTCMPGLIDVHSDGLEKERKPRPGAEVPADFAMLSFEGKLRAAGITTVFHGAGFEDGSAGGAGGGLDRSVAKAEQTCELVAARRDGMVDHRLLYRLDVRCPHGLAALQKRLGNDGDPRALVSHEDHTPGQGQYVDRSNYERYIAGTKGISAADAKAAVDTLIVTRAERLSVREQSLAWLGSLAREGRIRLLGHDPDSPAEIDALIDRGGSVAEFPTTIQAAKAAREHGLPVVIGAPNVLRGSSHTGNVSGRELIANGLVTALASDYLPSGLLAATTLLAGERICTLPEAVALVTSGAAEVAGLPDRGRIAPGQRADLVLVDTSARWPIARAVLGGGAT